MPFRGLLDTNILSAMMRNQGGALWGRLRREGSSNFCTSVIVAGELRFGAELVGSPRLRREVDAILEVVPALRFEAPADQTYAEIRSVLTKDGRLIGPNDLLIAAHALALDLTLITANTGEFSRVPGLRVENWL